MCECWRRPIMSGTTGVRRRVWLRVAYPTHSISSERRLASPRDVDILHTHAHTPQNMCHRVHSRAELRAASSRVQTRPTPPATGRHAVESFRDRRHRAVDTYTHTHATSHDAHGCRESRNTQEVNAGCAVGLEPPTRARHFTTDCTHTKQPHRRLIRPSARARRQVCQGTHDPTRHEKLCARWRAAQLPAPGASVGTPGGHRIHSHHHTPCLTRRRGGHLPPTLSTSLPLSAAVCRKVLHAATIIDPPACGAGDSFSCSPG